MLLLIFAGAARCGAAEEEPDAAACLECHGDEGMEASDGRSLHVDASAFDASPHGVLGCTVCHTDATEIPHAEELTSVGPEPCAGCHEEVVTEYRTSVHGRGREGRDPIAGCQDCHGDLHRLVSHDAPGSPMHWSKLAASCARCHADVALSEEFRIPVHLPVEAYLESVHGRAVTAGRRAAVCSDCHGAHDVLPSNDPRSPIWRSTVPDTCGKCHGAIAETFRQSVHGQALAKGVREAPVCTDCHGEHRILAPTDEDSPVFAANIPGETCGRCHGDTRLSAKYGLPLDKVSAFQDSFHGLALRAGQLAVANCASCHGVHDILPSSDPRSHVSHARLAETCGQCHPGAGSRFAIGPVHVSAANPIAAVDWIRLLYLWVIGIVVGAMFVHNAFDWCRKALRDPPPFVSQPDIGAERMSRALRWQHGLVMISFPVLVYTGFALTYPESWWARPLLRWENGLGLRGLLHRSAALVLIAALLAHAVHFAVSRDLRRRLHGLRWSRDDWSHLWARIAYYLGFRRTEPHGAVFTYIEKAEYWAFLWGVAIMSATGLLLWSTDAALRYLPKWIIDVATAIHFYEAVLATLAILVWHFYWVIFDPDVYPMDWSWWNGRAPARRVLERSAASGDVAEEPTTERDPVAERGGE
jgi:Ni,Fe-hydrogenase I cytochrome b subunit/nitrate/TMAO reductase-like tetraheme cytochrome c subunit